jgi:hypothetical protein
VLGALSLLLETLTVGADAVGALSSPLEGRLESTVTEEIESEIGVIIVIFILWALDLF